jgi:hypothetical protein
MFGKRRPARWHGGGDIEEIARRYLSTGSLRIDEVSDAAITATCRGRRGMYNLGYEAGRGWWCSCDSLDECPHLVALRLVTKRK